MAGERFQVSEELLNDLIVGNDVDYRDPLAEAGDGAEFKGSWLAAVTQIALPQNEDAAQVGGTSEQTNTDMLVLVQYRLSKVFEPVGFMKQQLLVEGALAVLSVVFVTFLMWYFVGRVSDRTGKDDANDDTPLPSHARTVTLK